LNLKFEQTPLLTKAPLSDAEPVSPTAHPYYLFHI